MAPAGKAVLSAVDRATAQVIVHVQGAMPWPAYSVGLGPGSLILSG